METITIATADHERLLTAEAQLQNVRALLPADVDPVAHVRQLLPQAADGQAYRDDLVAEALREGVRAYGNGFAQDVYTGILAAAPLATVKQMRADWQAVADRQFGSGRQTQDDKTDPPAGGTTAVVPDAAFAG